MTKIPLALALSLPLVACSRGGEPAAAPKPDAGIVQIAIDAQKSVGLTVAPASRGELTEYLHVLGTVQPIDNRIGTARSLARGRVQEVLVRVGDRVANGQPLARLDNIEAGELAAQYLGAQAELQKLHVHQATAARQVERGRSLSSIGAISQKDLELADAEHRALAEAVKAQESVLAGLDAKLRRLGLADTDVQKPPITTIRSSFAGVVLKVQAAPGDVVDPDVALFSIADLSEVWVQAEVYEKDISRVRTGQPALISVDAYPDQIFSGTVAHVSDTLDPKTRTAQVRCVVPNPNRQLKIDMFVRAEVPTTRSRTALSVPTDAIQDIEGKSVVFVRKSEVAFQIREVKVGLATGGRTEILAGLAEHDPVVVHGAFYLKSVRMNKELGEG